MTDDETYALIQRRNAVFQEVYYSLKRGDQAAVVSFLKSVPIDAEVQEIVAELAIRLRQLPLLRWILDCTRQLLHLPQAPGVDGSKSRLNFLLWVAMADANLEAVKILVDEYGADINVPSSVKGETPLSSDAAHTNYTALVRWMLDRGADPNDTANGCRCCFMMMTAAYKRNLPMTKLLVERGGLVNAMNAFGATPLTYAKMGGSKEVIEYLRSVCAKYPWEIRGEPEPKSPPLQRAPSDDKV